MMSDVGVSSLFRALPMAIWEKVEEELTKYLLKIWEKNCLLPLLSKKGSMTSLMKFNILFYWLPES
jgi:hypothetical protein